MQVYVVVSKSTDMQQPIPASSFMHAHMHAYLLPCFPKSTSLHAVEV